MKSKKTDLRWILHVLMALCTVGIFSSAFVLIFENREYVVGEDAYQQVRQIRELPETYTNLTDIDVYVTGQESEEENTYEHDDSIDFSALKKMNPDMVAWITSEGTEIDYPVVRGTDNDYYLHHLFTGERNKLGAIFVDYRNDGDFSDQNTILYGHNMKDGSMFFSLTKYKEQSYYDSIPAMVLYAPDGDFKIELFAGNVVDGNQESIRLGFKDDADFLTYVDSLKKTSSFKSSTAVTADDRIITLCTCSYEFNNARYALFGKLIPLN